MDLKNIGIDDKIWSYLWRGLTECNYDPVPFLSLSEPLIKDGMKSSIWKVMWEIAKTDRDLIHFLDSMSPNQVKSKMWLIEILEMILEDHDDLKVQLLGGWFGFPISTLLMNSFNIKTIENVDLDPNALSMFRMFSEDIEDTIFDGHCRDASEVGARDKDFHLVINTSSEHMPDLPEIIKSKKHRNDCLFALQSNNMFHVADHINCVYDEDHLAEKSGLSDVVYKGSIDMPNGYKRFMVIGYA